MSKELLKASQFRKADLRGGEDVFVLTDEQKKDLQELYGSIVNKFKSGSLIQGKIISVQPEGVLVDINFKSDGLIPLYEFSEHELKRLAKGSEVEVILDELETADGTVALSYEKAKALKAWDAIMKLHK